MFFFLTTEATKAFSYKNLPDRLKKIFLVSVTSFHFHCASEAVDMVLMKLAM
jgi:hypothetical protein